MPSLDQTSTPLKRRLTALEMKLGILFTNMVYYSTLKEGAPISFNGTDFFHFDECTGLIKQIEIAQDSIIEHYELGLSEIKL